MKTIPGSKLSLFSLLAAAAVVSATTLGSGSYRDGLPSAYPGPAFAPRVTSDFSGHPNTNDWSSSAVFKTDPGNGNPPNDFSYAMFAYPLLFNSDATRRAWERTPRATSGGKATSSRSACRASPRRS